MVSVGRQFETAENGRNRKVRIPAVGSAPIGTFGGIRKPYHQRGMDAMVELGRICSEDRATAEEAFIRFGPRIESFLHRYLRTWLPEEAERQDVISDTVLRIWLKRSNFELRGVEAWWSYVATVARRCALDRLGDRCAVPLDVEIPIHDHQSIEEILRQTRSRRALYRLADHVWLGRDPDPDDRQANRRVLAAQLYYFEGRPWQEVAHAVRLPHEERHRLDDWLSDSSTLLCAAFQELYWANPRLCEALLHSEAMNWSPDQKQIIIWRYQNGLLTEKILRMAPHLSRSFVEETFAKCREASPVTKSTEAVRRGFANVDDVLIKLAQPDFWKRIVFQYYAECELPQKQILERAEPAAEQCGYRLTDGILNVWISNNRLIAQLRGRVKEATD